VADLLLYASYAGDEFYSQHTRVVIYMHAGNHVGLYFVIIFNIHSQAKAKLIYMCVFLLHHRVSDEGEKVTCRSKRLIQAESVHMQSVLRKNKIV